MIAADTIILMLLTAIVVVVGLILWRAAEAKTYDPDTVDHSAGYDPKHDHFGQDHAKKFRQIAKATPKAEVRAVAATAATQIAISAEEPWDAHLIRTEQPLVKQAEASVAKHEEEKERRRNADRRTQERRTTASRRSSLGRGFVNL